MQGNREEYAVLGIIIGTCLTETAGSDMEWTHIAFGYIPNDKAEWLFPPEFIAACHKANALWEANNDLTYSIEIVLNTGSINLIMDIDGRKDETEEQLEALNSAIHGDDVAWANLFAETEGKPTAADFRNV